MLSPVQNTLPKSHITYIDGKVYDLTNFNHPGGNAAINLAFGRDSTSLFHSYHPMNDRHKQILAKYLVRDSADASDCVSEVFGKQVDDASFGKVFDWTLTTESPFWTELRDEVRVALLEVGTTKATTLRFFQLSLILMSVLFILPSYISGAWWAMVAFPVSYWLLAVNVFHDASHFSLFKDWRLNHYATYCFPHFSSSYTWYHQHVIGHHAYTNTEHDPDMHHGVAVWRYTLQTKYKKFFRYQIYYLFLIWQIIVLHLSFIEDISLFVKGRYEAIRRAPMTTGQVIAHVILRIVTFYSLFIWPFLHPEFSWAKSIIFAWVPFAIFSCCFAFSSQLNHIIPDTMDKKQDRNWYIHQISTSHSFAPQSLFWFIFTGGLNLQVEHHLFPGINSIHLRKIQPIVQRVCKKHGIRYNLSETALEAFEKHIDQIIYCSEDR
jgi:fatty acid desaturase